MRGTIRTGHVSVKRSRAVSFFSEYFSALATAEQIPDLACVSQKATTVRRYDRPITLDAKRVIRTDEGYLRAPARLTRTGVFHYRDPSTGERWSELRLPEDVFNADSLASFELLPVIVNHIGPNIAVTAENAKGVQVGSVGGIHQDKEDPQFVCGTVLITDGETVAAVERGKVELSNGYFSEKEPAPPGSVYKDPNTGISEPYQYIQRNIRGNHVAIVDQGRAGPGAKIMLDHNDAIEHTDGEPVTQRKGHPMKKITIDGVQFEVSETVAQAYEKSMSEAKANVDRLQARCDNADSQVKKLTNDLATATDPKRFAEAVASRLALVQTATAHEIKCDGLDDMAIRRAVIGKANADLKLDGKSDEYVRAAFDLVVTKNPVVDQLTSPGGAPIVTDSAPGAHRAAHAKGFYGVDPTKRQDQK